MGFRAAKISFDGSHYIATPKENFPRGKKRRRSSRPTSEQETERKEQFETAYKESQKLPKKERKEYVKKAMEEAIPDKEQRQVFVERNSERKKINAIRRKVRLSKKANLQTWNFFCTFTYSDEKHTEESFRKSLRNTLGCFIMLPPVALNLFFTGGSITQMQKFRYILSPYTFSLYPP